MGGENVRLAELLAALSLAFDLGMGRPLEDFGSEAKGAGIALWQAIAPRVPPQSEGGRFRELPYEQITHVLRGFATSGDSEHITWIREIQAARDSRTDAAPLRPSRSVSCTFPHGEAPEAWQAWSRPLHFVLPTGRGFSSGEQVLFEQFAIAIYRRGVES